MVFYGKKREKIVGYYWGIRDINRKCYYVILAGVDKEYSWYSPSISHLYLWISEMYDKGNDLVRIIDFTVGDERYKTDIGGTIKYIEKYEFDI